jgi:hypothetical protein
MRNKALQYAEDELKVHEVYELAVAAQSNLKVAQAALLGEKSNKANLQERIAERRADLQIEERGLHSDMAVTRFDEHMKAAERKDEELVDLRTQLSTANYKITSFEYDIEADRLQIRILTERMHLLGGYFAYLAAVKTQSLQVQ